MTQTVISRRTFVGWAVALLPLTHRPNHPGKPSPTPTPTPTPTGTGFRVGVSAVGGAHLVGGT